jgi:protein ImuB
MFAVLHVAEFALHAVLRTEHGVTDQPAALFSGTGKKSIVLAANPLARRAGVELGMTAPQAVARCARLVIRTSCASAEAEARAALLAVGATISPAIEDTAPGVCTIDLRGSDSALHEKRAARAVADLIALGLPATGGIARTPLLALYAARSSAPTPSTRDHNPARARDRNLNHNPDRPRAPDPSLPRHNHSASDAITITSKSTISTASGPHVPKTAPLVSARKNAAVLLVPVSDEKNFLAPLPLVAAEPPPELADVFAHWGLRTLGELTALPRDEIVRRFGAAGLAFWQRASGGEPRPLRLVAPAQEFSAQMEFENEIETLEPLLFVLRRFLDRLTLELQASQHVAAELDLALRLENETSHTHHFRLPEPTADVEILFRAVHTHLESLQTAASIIAVELRITPARPLVRQQGLFETGLRDPHGFAETLARVAALVGHDRVGTPQLEDTHRPDAVKLVAPAAVVPPPAIPLVHPPLGLPLRRFRPPLAARIEFTDGQPTYLWTDDVHGEISRRSPAFPSSGDWWQRDRSWSRTEWDIALAGGGLYRLVRTGDSYFVEGEYD